MDETFAELVDAGVDVRRVCKLTGRPRSSGESRERRRQATHPSKVKPELVAHQPGEVYSWDITKLRRLDQPTQRPTPLQTN